MPRAVTGNAMPEGAVCGGAHDVLPSVFRHGYVLHEHDTRDAVGSGEVVWFPRETFPSSKRQLVVEYHLVRGLVECWDWDLGRLGRLLAPPFYNAV